MITESEILEIGQEILERFIVPSYVSSEHNTTGELLNSLSVRVEGSTVIFSGNDYTQWVMFGREPNRNQDPEYERRWVKWFAPNVFQPWINAKGLNMNAYALAYKIARTGTKKYRDGGENLSNFFDILTSPEVRNFVEEKVKGMAQVRIRNIIREEFKRL